MDIKSTFDDAVSYICLLLGVTLVGTGFSVAFPPSSLTPLTDDCTAGDFEVSAIWFAIFLSLFSMFNGIMLIGYGRMHLRRDSNLDANALPTRHLYLILVWMHCLIVLAVIATSIAFFFIFEVNYTKFHCMPRLFQYGVPSFAVNIGVACSFIIYYVWQTPYGMHDDKKNEGL